MTSPRRSLFPDIEAALLDLPRDRSFEHFEDVCRTIRQALTPARVKELVESDLARIRDGDLQYDPASRPNYLVALSAESEVNLALYGAGSASPPKPMVLARDCAFGVVKGGPVTVNVYRLPSPAPEDRIDPDAPLDEPSPVTLSAGDWITAARLRTCYEVAHVHRQAVCGRVFGPVQSAFNVAYDRASRHPDGLVNAIDSVSRIESALRIIAKTSPDAGLGVANELLGHPVHTVRWAATQLACKADPHAAPRLLEKLLDDPHPRIRAGAAAQLRSLDRRAPDGADAQVR